ncbi:MAG TPA: TetR/AcrR family transcriptional regulator [Steroidobacteraceae bacterium]|jgi:TetR/AcrR family transcriptional repressor of nem operon
MRYQSEHKEQTRQRVLTEAAAAIRESGPDGIGVAAIMAKAGLTHGAFYAHFESKDDLVAQAISRMFEESSEKFLKRTENLPAAAALTHYLDMYLSTRHRDAPQSGCPLPSLSGEVARLPDAARARFASGLETLTAALAGRIRELGHADPEMLATSMISEMVGALAMSRAVEDTAESDRILQASRNAIKARLSIPTGSDGRPAKAG